MHSQLCNAGNRLGLGLWCLMPLSTIFQLLGSISLWSVLSVEESGVNLALIEIRAHNISSDRH